MSTLMFCVYIPIELVHSIIDFLEEEDLFIAQKLAPCCKYMNDVFQQRKRNDNTMFLWQTSRFSKNMYEFSPYFTYQNTKWRVLFYSHDNPFHGKVSKTRYGQAKLHNEIEMYKKYLKRKPYFRCSSSVAVYLECKEPVRKNVKFACSVRSGRAPFWLKYRERERFTQNSFIQSKDNWGFSKIKANPLSRHVCIRIHFN